PCENVTAEVVDGTGPGRFFERPNFGQVEALAQYDFGRAERPQEVAFLFLARQRDTVIAQLGQDVDGHAAPPTGRAVDDHRAAARGQTVVLHELDGLRCGE